MSVPTRYFARTLHGLEDLSWRDIAGRSSSTLLGIRHRTVEFSSTTDPLSLSHLRGVEDLFVVLGELEEVTHERSALKLIQEQVSRLSLRTALQAVASLRSIPENPTYSVTASFVGARNYNRWELAEAVRAGLAPKKQLRYVETRESTDLDTDLHFRLILEGSEGLLGLRLARHPLHKRGYKTQHTPGSLSPVLAYHLVRLAQLRAHEVFLDPMCGAGTLPIEAAHAEPDSITMGMDIDSGNVAASRQNGERACVPVAWMERDFFHNGLEACSVDVVASDFPWGDQSTLHTGSIETLCEEIRRILGPGGRLVLLCEDEVRWSSALAASGFSLSESVTVSVHGRHPRILVCKLAGSEPLED